ncbi:T9SS type A sorting domain-containing protein [Winogradskyella wichelsiae]|uniref:T9SS type A sorting domain-containing protein n=1 Tax=Winogradskyella wichelsiae TaxID=2697007 RepID=UPI0015CCEBB7|nr:T9SS type A sorting domain-containing protein [Winogradskyella wichelsiae]
MNKYYVSILLIFPLLSFSQTTFTSTITPDLSAYGEVANHPGEGEYEIFLSTDGILDKPIIVVDGFDTGDLRDINGIYSLLDFAGTSGTDNLADQLRAQGFDVIILNFPVYTRNADGATIDGGTDFIERNALLLVELINSINTDKASNSPEQNVIIGPSMGGLIARYALNYMEANVIDADTRLYISFDAPHLGANFPIGLQHQLNYLANNPLSPVTELQPVIEGLLQSPAGRQLLIDHLESHLTGDDLFTFDANATLPVPHPYRIIFNADINNLTPNGFPENVRNVAIANGSGNGSFYLAADGITPVTNGFTIVDVSLPVDSPLGGTIDVDIDINMTPAAGAPQQVSRFFAPLFPPFVPDILNAASSGTVHFDGVDAAPGGLFDLSTLTASFGTTGGIGDAFFAALQIDKFSYIPTVSALALDITDAATGNEINWHYSDDFTNATPFVNSFVPEDNEPHVLLTEANVAFALVEILNTPLHVLDSELYTFKLEKNPVQNQLILRSNLNSAATITINDLTGKTVFNSTKELTERTIINIALNTGFYILNVASDYNTFTTRFIVNR